MIFEIVRFGKFSGFFKLEDEQISKIVECGHLTKFRNFTICKINKFIDFFPIREIADSYICPLI